MANSCVLSLPSDDGAGFAELADAGGVLFGDVIDENFRVGRRRQAGDVDDVLDADRDAVKRASRAAGGEFVLRGSGGVHRGLRVEADERMKSGLQMFDALQ